MKLCISISRLIYPYHHPTQPPHCTPLAFFSKPTNLSSPAFPRSPLSLPQFKQIPPLRSSSVDATPLGSNAEDRDEVGGLNGDVKVVVEKNGRNRRWVSANICIEAPLEVVWQVLTDYESLADFIPSLVACQLVEKREGGARLLQIAEQDIALGFKFRAKGVLDVQENPVQISSHSIWRDIMFEMIEGDFQVFRGCWHLEQVEGSSDGSCKESDTQGNLQTVLSYSLDVQPKIWLPVSLVENRLAKELEVNLSSVRDRAITMTGSLL